MPKKRPSQGPILNVIFHGAFAFLEEEKQQRIRVMIPVIAGHEYRAGNWLGETRLRRGMYELKGVTPGRVSQFNAGRNLIVSSKKPAARPLPYATLFFPLPDKIKSLRTAKVPTSDFTNRRHLLVKRKKQHISTLQIFTYNFTSANELLLQSANGGHYWEPVMQAKKKKKGKKYEIERSINLHIFSVEDCVDEPFQAGDFRKCAQLLGSTVNLKSQCAYQPSAIANTDLPYGVIAAETEDLAPRTLRLARLGRLVSQGDNANQAWYKDDALDDQPPTCGPLIGS
jgi:hypothetical protein